MLTDRQSITGRDMLGDIFSYVVHIVADREILSVTPFPAGLC